MNNFLDRPLIETERKLTDRLPEGFNNSPVRSLMVMTSKRPISEIFEQELPLVM